jgi:hypothetical protein
MIPATVTRNREIRLEDDAQRIQIEDYHSPTMQGSLHYIPTGTYGTGTGPVE